MDNNESEVKKTMLDYNILSKPAEMVKNGAKDIVEKAIVAPFTDEVGYDVWDTIIKGV